MSLERHPDTGVFYDGDEVWNSVYFDNDTPTGNFPDAAQRAIELVDAIKVEFYQPNSDVLGAVGLEKKISPDNVNAREMLEDISIEARQLENVREFFESMEYDVWVSKEYDLPDEVEALEEVYGERGSIFTPAYNEIDQDTVDILEENGAVYGLSDLRPGDEIKLDDELIEEMRKKDIVSENDIVASSLQSMRRMYNGDLYHVSPQMINLFEADFT